MWIVSWLPKSAPNLRGNLVYLTCIRLPILGLDHHYDSFLLPYVILRCKLFEKFIVWHSSCGHYRATMLRAWALFLLQLRDEVFSYINFYVWSSWTSSRQSHLYLLKEGLIAAGILLILLLSPWFSRIMLTWSYAAIIFRSWRCDARFTFSWCEWSSRSIAEWWFRRFFVMQASLRSSSIEATSCCLACG